MSALVILAVSLLVDPWLAFMSGYGWQGAGFHEQTDDHPFDLAVASTTWFSEDHVDLLVIERVGAPGDC